MGMSVGRGRSNEAMEGIEEECELATTKARR